MDALNPAVGTDLSIIALDQQKRPALHDPSFDRSDIEINRRCKAHDEGFVLRCALEAGNGRLDDVRRRLTWAWQADRAINKNHGHFGLRASERQSQLALTCQQRTLRQCIEDADQTDVVQRHGLRVHCRQRRRLARRKQLQRAGDVTTQPVEKCKVVRARDAERKSDTIALVLFRQKAAEEGSTGAPLIGLWPLG